ncbi:MAG TPA: VWA domain-containing protein [Pyrinomonadaceae bacterium]
MTRSRLPRAPLCALALALAPLAPAVLTARQQVPQTQTAQAAPPPVEQPTVKIGFYVVDGANRTADVRREEVSLTVDGAPQAVTYFAREESPVSYGLVVDNSGSMRQILETLTRTGGALVGANRPEDEAFVMRFVDQPRTNILEDFTSDKQSLASALADMYVEGGQTAVVDAIYRAAEHAAERGREGGGARRLALVVVTDGEDRGSKHKTEELTQLLQREGVRVFFIGLTGLLDNTGGFIRQNSREKAASLLQTISAESGGRAFIPNFGKGIGDELALAVKEIGDSLRAQYVVGFTPQGPAADGKFHRVQIKVAEAAGKGKRKVVAAPGYFARGAVKQAGGG